MQNDNNMQGFQFKDTPLRKVVSTERQLSGLVSVRVGLEFLKYRIFKYFSLF